MPVHPAVIPRLPTNVYPTLYTIAICLLCYYSMPATCANVALPLLGYQCLYLCSSINYFPDHSIYKRSCYKPQVNELQCVVTILTVTYMALLARTAPKQKSPSHSLGLDS